MAMGVPPELTVKHSALKVCVGASAVDSDAEDEDSCARGVASSSEETLLTNKGATAVDENT